MKIIQSYAQFDSGSPYIRNNQLDGSEVYINFYTFLLSYLTLKKYYGAVTMYCNKEAYNSFIKYIPYDEVIIKENENSFAYWNFYKVNAIQNTTGDLIHVDSDVFIFDDLFREFIDNDYDGIVQDVVSPNNNKYFVGEFVNDNRTQLKVNNIFDAEIYDGKCFSCGVLGIKERVKEYYVNMAMSLKENLSNGTLYSRYTYVGAISEELGYYLTSLKHGFKVHSVLPYDEILKYGQAAVANNKKYTHLWFHSKFKKENIELIKKKIYKEFNADYSLIEKYEKALKRKKIVMKFL